MYTSLRSAPGAFRRALAHRSANGLDVTLLRSPANGQDGESIVVCVCDSRDGEYSRSPPSPI
jgi:hypothetical protein